MYVPEDITEQEFERLKTFFSRIKYLSQEEILLEFGSLSMTFSQLEQDIETTLRIPREYLMQKVLSRDISDVSLENLETVLPLLTSRKRQLSNTLYENFFNNLKGELTKQDRKLLKEAKERLKLFVGFQTTIKEVVELHIEIKKLFASVKLTQNSEFQDISSLPIFDELIDKGLRVVTEEVKSLTPTLKQPHLLKNSTYTRVMDGYMSELEQDIVRLEQIERWKKVAQNKEQSEYLIKVEKKVVQLQRMHRGTLFIAYSSKQNVNEKLLALLDQTYALEGMIDSFQ